MSGGAINSYALGFIKGLNESLGKQSTALMVIVPPDVTEKYAGLRGAWNMARTGEKRPSMVHRAFAERFKAERERSGYTQYDVAKILEVSQEIISAYERARAVPYAEDLVAISLLFRVSADYLPGMTRKRDPYEADAANLEG